VGVGVTVAAAVGAGVSVGIGVWVNVGTAVIVLVGTNDGARVVTATAIGDTGTASSEWEQAAKIATNKRINLVFLTIFRC
jgi:hypothetical protein